jgi:hypothetical protein
MIEIDGWKSAASGVDCSAVAKQVDRRAAAKQVDRHAAAKQNDRFAVAKKVDWDPAVGVKGEQAHAQRR